MKTPDLIKKALGACGVLDGDCENCPYDDGANLVCADRVRKDALAYIQQLEGYLDEEGEYSEILCIEVRKLESRLAQVERERDAAVADMEECANGYCINCKNSNLAAECDCTGECYTCLNEECPCHERNCRWQWRGVCPENTKEADSDGKAESTPDP